MNSREPKIGDVIRTATPTRTDTPMYPAGTYLRVRLANQESVDLAHELIAEGRWIVDPQPHAEHGPASDTTTTREGE